MRVWEGGGINRNLVNRWLMKVSGGSGAAGFGSDHSITTRSGNTRSVHLFGSSHCAHIASTNIRLGCVFKHTHQCSTTRWRGRCGLRGLRIDVRLSTSVAIIHKSNNNITTHTNYMMARLCTHTLLDTILSRALILILLMIGTIETNPGMNNHSMNTTHYSNNEATPIYDNSMNIMTPDGTILSEVTRTVISRIHQSSHKLPVLTL